MAYQSLREKYIWVASIWFSHILILCYLLPDFFYLCGIITLRLSLITLYNILKNYSPITYKQYFQCLMAILRYITNILFWIFRWNPCIIHSFIHIFPSHKYQKYISVTIVTSISMSLGVLWHNLRQSTFSPVCMLDLLYHIIYGNGGGRLRKSL